MTARHFPPPWSVEDKGACFIVRDHNGQALAYVYYDHPQAGDLTWDEARRIAANALCRARIVEGMPLRKETATAKALKICSERY